MEEIDEKRKFQKRYEGWSSHRSWIFCGILYLWHDAVAGGLSIWQAVLISLTNLTSAGQFAGLDIIFAGGSMWRWQ